MSAALSLARSTASAVLSMVFQPIIDLRTEGVVGYEALARGPVGSPWERPDDLFAQARLEGRLREMDWACRVAAVRDARACSPELPEWRLFVNTEPEVLGTICPEDLLADWVDGTGELAIVVEVTERALVHGPRRLLAAVDELRALGCEIALDDVGANEASVALLPLIEPDVVKLDAPLLSAADEASRTSLRAVASYVERTGAVVVAEGIETDLDRARAVDLGACWGQGFLFARPRPLGVCDGGEHGLVAGRGPARQRPQVDLRPQPLGDVPRIVAGPERVAEHLRWVARAAMSGPATNVLLVRLPDPSLAPAGFFEQVAALQEACALTLVVLGEDATATAGPRSDELVAVLLGPSVAHGLVATPVPDGRYDVLVDERPEEVAALARRFLAGST